MEKKVVICGAGGFIGSHLATRLKKEGCWVRGVDLKYPEFSKTSCDEFIIGDLRDPKTVEVVIPEDIDELFQFGADMGGAGYIFTGSHDADVMHNSAMINLNVANECVKKKVKKVFYSSSACAYPEYNQLEPDNPKCSEDSAYPAQPDSCLSSDTEVMTKKGFKFIEDIDLTDEIATLSPEGYLEFHHPADKQILKYSGKLIRFKSKNYDCLVTPEHKVMILEKRDSIEFKRIKAKDFISDSRFTKGFFKRNCLWCDSVKYNDIVRIPSVCFEKNSDKEDRGNRKKNGYKFKIDDYLKFIGWFVTEGNCGFYGGKDYITQIRQCKEDNLKSIILLCEEMGLRVEKSSYKKQRVIINSKALWNHLKEFGHGAKNKKLLSWILELSADKLKILFDTMMLGDGTISKTSNRMAYSTSSPILRDQFVEICLKIGYSCTIHTTPLKGNINEHYKINISRYNRIHKVTNDNISYVEYDGIVYDLTVPNHIFYIRRNGRHIWTGNSYGWEKLFSEILYLSYNRNYGLDVRICRYHNIFGPLSCFDNGKEKAPAAICRKVAEADNNSTIEIWGDGLQTRSFLYIDECLEATLRLMRNDSGFMGPVNIGSEEMISINDFTKMIINISGKNLKIKNIPGPEGVRGRNSDNKLYKEKMNWVVSRPLKEGMEKLYKWVEEQVNNQPNK